MRDSSSKVSYQKNKLASDQNDAPSTMSLYLLRTVRSHSIKNKKQALFSSTYLQPRIQFGTVV